MADSIQEMAVFARVVGAGSLSAAARELGLSPALVSRRLAALETRLGVRLINRTTRSLHLTDDGATYYEACARVLADIEEADATVSAGRVEPRGALRVALPASFGLQHIAPLVPRFAERYPQIQLALSLSDRTVNLIEEGFDLAVRIAHLEDSSLTARRLAPNSTGRVTKVNTTAAAKNTKPATARPITLKMTPAMISQGARDEPRLATGTMSWRNAIWGSPDRCCAAWPTSWAMTATAATDRLGWESA